MKDYLINSGEFNIIVRPDKKQFFILEENKQSSAILRDFIEGNDVSYEALTPSWFKYSENESWRNFDQEEFKLNIDFQESDLIEQFVLKKFNFGSLVAIRDNATMKVKVFKRDKM